MRKGQNLILEQVFIFTIGLAIFIIVYFSFLNVSKNIESVTKEDQINELGKYLSSCIVRSYVGPENSTTVYNIPKDISGSGYKIYFSGNVLKLKVNGGVYNFTLDPHYNFNGGLSSQIGKIKIEKIDNQITVEKYEY